MKTCLLQRIFTYIVLLKMNNLRYMATTLIRFTNTLHEPLFEAQGSPVNSRKLFSKDNSQVKYYKVVLHDSSSTL